MGVRPERVQEALRHEISTVVHDHIKDPRVGFLTITKVELTKDLRYAKVYFSVLGDAKAKKRALYGLNSAKGYIKGIVGDNLKLRFTPELDFRIDDSFEKYQEIKDILDKLKKEQSDGKGTADTQEQ
jgi:ribosome-binding factor A